MPVYSKPCARCQGYKDESCLALPLWGTLPGEGEETFKKTSHFRDAAVLADEWSQREERSFQPGWC